MCEQCEGFNVREPVMEIYRFRDLVRQLDNLIQRLVFILIEGRDLWPRIASWNGPQPDCAQFQFECSICRSVFVLGADFYRGRASWELLIDRQVHQQHPM